MHDICWLQTVDFLTKYRISIPLLRANRQQANLIAIQANLTDIKANQSAIYNAGLNVVCSLQMSYSAFSPSVWLSQCYLTAT